MKQIVNFSGKFIRRIGHLARPLCELLKKDVNESEWPWKPDTTVETCRYKRSNEAMREYGPSDRIVPRARLEGLHRDSAHVWESCPYTSTASID
eukprot:3922080-Pleurochrysis_carterae.AAC.4